MTGEEPAEASHTQAVQTQTPCRRRTQAVPGCCKKPLEKCTIHWVPGHLSECCHGHCLFFPNPIGVCSNNHAHWSDTETNSDPKHGVH
ncbi:unnamed protein product [Polarella glacialis]|uniref:Uncharacterized protein n=1 Tax=Polarella glacialis TaxID=89957 RepID=A0A813E6B4_POLGL|nr:unnamed protein product [Polarella glacialis]